MIIMNSNKLWQNGFYVNNDDGSTADYDNDDDKENDNANEDL